MIDKLFEALREGYRSGRNRPPVRSDGMPVHMQTGAATKHRQSVEATIIKACGKCAAPGTWSSTPEARERWPGVWVDANSSAVGWPIGNKCPNCGMARPQNEVLGEVWVKEEK